MRCVFCYHKRLGRALIFRGRALCRGKQKGKSAVVFYEYASARLAAQAIESLELSRKKAATGSFFRVASKRRYAARVNGLSSKGHGV
jgi:hypothetical protein